MKRFRAPSPDEKKHRFPIALRGDLSAAVQRVAEKSRWSMAATSEVLIEEALRARGELTLKPIVPRLVLPTAKVAVKQKNRKLPESLG